MSLRRQLIKARCPCIPTKHSDLYTGPCFSWGGPTRGDMVASKNQKASKPKLTSIESVMPSNHLILCCSVLLLPSINKGLESFFLVCMVGIC